MKRIGPVLILLGVIALGRAAYVAFTSASEALLTAVAGCLLAGLGYHYVNPGPKEDPEPQTVSRASPSTGTAEKSASEPPETVFSVIQTGDDSLLDKVERLLEQDPRVTSVVSETGRWHSTPDCDDLPEWHALRAYCSRDLVEQVMQDIEETVRTKLGENAAAELSFSRFS